MQNEFFIIARMPCQKIIYRNLVLFGKGSNDVIKLRFKHDKTEKEKNKTKNR